MMVSFVGGSLDKQEQIILEIADLLEAPNKDVYAVKFLFYKNLGWFYVWYEYVAHKGYYK